MRISLRGLLLAAVLLAQIQRLGAVELGEIISVSRAGSALRVEVALSATDGALPEQSSCFSLASDPPNPNGLAVLASGRPTLRTQDGRHSLIVTSNQRIDGDALLGLRVGCGSNAKRDYLLSLPPALAPAQAAFAERSPAAPATPVPAVEAAVPEARQAPPVKRAAPRKLRPAVARPGVSGDRLAVSLTEADDALARRLAAPGPADYRAAGAEAVALNARLSELEATVARLRAELAAASPEPIGPPPAVAQRESGAAQIPMPTAAAADSALAVVPRSLKPDAAEQTGYSIAWLLAFAAGGALLAFAAVALARRWPALRSAGALAADRPPATLQGPASASADADIDGDVPPGPPTIEVVEPKSPLELADFMLSFGRVDDAAMALEEYIANNPKSAIEPWQKLLEIYRQVGRRHAFDSLARRMQKTFNVEAPRWERDPAERSTR